MTDWQVGDLAVCVDVEPRAWSDLRYLGMLQLGATYRVIGIRVDAPILGLFVEGVPDPAATDASRFRKVIHDKREACEDEFVTLLNRTKVPVGVSHG